MENKSNIETGIIKIANGKIPPKNIVRLYSKPEHETKGKTPPKSPKRK